MPQLISTIATSAAWPAVSWTVQTALRVDSLALRVFPNVSQATVSQHYGYIATPGLGAEVVAPVDLAGQFCRVTVYDGTATTTWYGYCPGGTDAVSKTHANPATGAGAIPSGQLVWNVYGFEYFLQSMTYDRCQTTAGSIRRVLPFNYRRGRGGVLAGNRAASPISGSLYTFDASGTSSWTALQAVLHILEVFRTQSGIAITLGGQTTELGLVSGAWDMGDGDSYADAIRRVIDPRLGWALICCGADLTAVSIADAAIGDLPANPNVVTLDLETSGTMERPRVTTLNQAHYDTITVRGEPLRVMLTLTVSGGELAADWDTALATAYAAETTDEGRRQDKYRTLWSRFRLPLAWDGKVKNLYGFFDRYAFPAIDPTTGYPPINPSWIAADTTAPQVMWLPELLFDRTTPAMAPTTDTQPGEPIVIAYDNIAGALVRLDDAPRDEPGADIAMCDDRPGVLLRPAYRHLLAYGSYTGDSSHPAKFIYSSAFKATVSCYTFDRVRVTVAAVVAEPGQVNREKIIDIPECHLWLILANTSTDLGTIEPADRYLRDDVAILAEAAALARAWYGRPRASIAVTYTDPLVLNRLGHVISDVRSAGAIQQAGTMITDITYSLAGRQTTNFATELFDLDFSRRSGFGGRRRA